MAILFRVLLFALLIYLIVKMIREFLPGPGRKMTNVKSSGKERKVSRDVGEYVDFEEVNEGKGQSAKGEGRTGEEDKQGEVIRARKNKGFQVKKRLRLSLMGGYMQALGFRLSTIDYRLPTSHSTSHFLSFLARLVAKTNSFRGLQSEWSISSFVPSHILAPRLINTTFSPISITEFIS